MLGLASPLLVNCGALPGGLKPPGPLGDIADAAGGCDEMASGDFSKLEIKGDAAIKGKIIGFLDAAASLKNATLTMETDLIASCGELGKALGMPEADLKAEAKDGEGAKKVCTAVSAKVSEMFKANASAQISISIGAPKVHADIAVMTKCLEACGSPIKGGDFKASCKGGEISGKCEGKCSGSCTLDAGAECSGTCKAECSGKCDAGFRGTCTGKCDGKCDGKDQKGKECKGVCEGKCDAGAEGSCTGTCGGKCSGSCEVKADAGCKGNCSGGCSVEYKEPSCSGEFNPPSVDPSCQINCAAKGAVSAKIEPPEVKIEVKGKASTDVIKFVNALQVTLPKLVKIQLGSGKAIASSVVAVGKAGADLKSAVVSAGGKAIACVAAGVQATVSASASIKVNVDVSASASASASGKAGG
jgi:hypothetical protein